MTEPRLAMIYADAADGSTTIEIWAREKESVGREIERIMHDADIHGDSASFHGPLRVTGGYVAHGKYEES